MAVFTNFATLSYNGQTLTSNTVTGQLLETVAAVKTALTAAYNPDGSIAYVVSLSNSGDQPVTGLTVTDDLGGYEFDGATVYPLAYRDGTARYLVNGALQPAPTVTAGPPLAFTGLSIPAGGNIQLYYVADVTDYAPLGAGGEISNTATVTGPALAAPLRAAAAVPANQGADLRITKSLSPDSVMVGDSLTYTFLIENHGAAAVAAGDNVVMADTFDPILSGLTVSYNAARWAAGTNYTYDAASGVFTSLAGFITVPAATYTQQTDGTWVTVPGTATLTITGTVQPG